MPSRIDHVVRKLDRAGPVTADVTSILLRMNEIVDAANISQLNSNAPAVFPMGVRLGLFFNAHAVGVGGDGGEKYYNAGEDRSW